MNSTLGIWFRLLGFLLQTCENNTGLLTLPLGLIDETQGIAPLGTVKEIQSSAQHDPPPSVCLNKAIMFAGVEGVAEGDLLCSRATLNLIELFRKFDFFLV